MEPLLTIREVSQLTGLSVGTLYHMISDRRIPVVRISARCVRFRRSDIEEWIAGKVIPPEPVAATRRLLGGDEKKKTWTRVGCDGRSSEARIKTAG
jgi:excisionase family DNA binding protein